MYRGYCEEGLNLQRKGPKRNRSAAHRQPVEGNASSLHECWGMDFVCNQHYNGNRFRALTVVDNGSEFISKVLDKWAYENNDELDFARPGKPTDNPFIESFNDWFRVEYLNANWFFSLEDVQEKFDI